MKEGRGALNYVFLKDYLKKFQIRKNANLFLRSDSTQLTVLKEHKYIIVELLRKGVKILLKLF